MEQKVGVIVEVKELYSKSITNNALSILCSIDDTKDLLTQLWEYDAITYQHCMRVSYFSVLLGSSLGCLSQGDLTELAMAGWLHDIGKLMVDYNILSAPRKLTPIEYKAVQRHVEFGEKLLEPIALSEQVKKGVAQHHELINSTGYPNHLKGNEISLFGQVLAVCDVYDALTSKRHYKDALPFYRVASIMRDNAGLRQDFVQILLNLVSSSVGCAI